MEQFLDIALIITSIALIVSVVLQSKGAGLGGLTGSDSGGVFSARRGIEKTLFRITIVLALIFFGLAIFTILFVLCVHLHIDILYLINSKSMILFFHLLHLQFHL